MTTRHDIATFIIGLASIITMAVFILAPVKDMVLVIIQMIPYCIIYFNIRAKPIVFIHLIGIVCVVAGLGIYCDIYILYIVPPDPQSPIGLAFMPFIQTGIYFFLVSIIGGLTNFRLK